MFSSRAIPNNCNHQGVDGAMPTTDKKYKADTVRAAFSPYAVGPENDGEQRMFCPICEDPLSSNSPSASMNAESGVWNCLKGNHGGSIYNLVQDLKRERGFDIRRESMRGRHANPEYTEKIQKQLGNSSTPLPSQSVIEKWATA